MKCLPCPSPLFPRILGVIYFPFFCSFPFSVLFLNFLPFLFLFYFRHFFRLGQVGIVMPSGTGNAGITQFLLGVNDASYLDNR